MQNKVIFHHKKEVAKISPFDLRIFINEKCLFEQLIPLTPEKYLRSDCQLIKWK